VLRLLDATPLRAVHTGRAPVVLFFVLSGYVLARSLSAAAGRPGARGLRAAPVAALAAAGRGRRAAPGGAVRAV
jgi:peptidoglycan/LPS O-acetylase OafA/YrhL